MEPPRKPAVSIVPAGGDMAAPASVPPETRVYAISDIHGRADLLRVLLDAIAADAENGPDRQVLVTVGDYVDRGPCSRQTVDLLLDGIPQGMTPVRLMGNHEWMMREFLRDLTIGRVWLDNGGGDTLVSYGLDRPTRRPGWSELLEMQDALRHAIPARHRAFLDELATLHREGGYVFVHAGVRPGVAIEDQDPEDLLWIRDTFLSSDADLGGVVVHGHTVTLAPKVLPNRIAIDTGAFSTSRLTTLVLEGDRLRFMVAQASPPSHRE